MSIHAPGHVVRLLLAGLLGSSVLLGAVRADAAGYRFTQVAESDAAVPNLGVPVINELGVLAYRYVTSDNRQLIVTNNAGVITTIIQSGEPISFVNPPESINDAGTVAFYVQTNNNTRTAIFSGSGGPSTVVAQAGTVTPLGIVNGVPGGFPDINHSGAIAFTTFLANPSRIAQIVRNPDGTFVGIADSSGPIFGMSPVPLLDNQGNVYFRASFDQDQQAVGLFTGNGGPLVTLFDTLGGAFTSLLAMSINNNGALVFVGRPAAGGEFLYRHQAGTLTPLLPVGEAYARIVSTDINDNGTVVFQATLAAGGEGVFTGPDPLAHRVIATGDPLFGSVVTRAIFRRGHNNRGQIAFYAELEDGRQVIALADREDATPPGSGIVVTPTDPDPVTGNATPVTLSFSSVTSGGTTTVTTSSTGTPPPSGLKLGSPPVYYEISTTAQHAGPITICIDYSGVSYGNEGALKLMHLENGTWVDVTSSRDPANDIICGIVQSLSPFAVFEPDPYPFTGYFPPVVNLPGVTGVRAGAALPVKFSLGGDRGLQILRPGYPKSQEVACGSWAEGESLEDTGTAGQSGLNYDPATDQYVYVWKTEAGWRGTCRQFELGLNDDTSHAFIVQFPNR